MGNLNEAVMKEKVFMSCHSVVQDPEELCAHEL
jgi:hypothetical protein